MSAAETVPIISEHEADAVQRANASGLAPVVVAHKSVGQVADHFAAITASLARKPVTIDHSFGGLLAQILAGRGLAAGTGGDRPGALPRGLPLPISSLRSALAALAIRPTGTARSR